jgi:hypothetical protein
LSSIVTFTRPQDDVGNGEIADVEVYFGGEVGHR